ncbi:unnamed protein product [Ambrosiozyma monospora]|uniref:Unnamed protein product n=1 Tax=Ambrosiozyma monospora TaxID=43982 RepID=A0A9W6T217_AMBMO|nr:unnamed protein product [Ambrosiozyma monospora]
MSDMDLKQPPNDTNTAMLVNPSGPTIVQTQAPTTMTWHEPSAQESGNTQKIGANDMKPNAEVIRDVNLQNSNTHVNPQNGGLSCSNSNNNNEQFKQSNLSPQNTQTEKLIV